MSRNIQTKNRTFLSAEERTAQSADGKVLFTTWQGHRGAFLVRNHKLIAVSIFPEHTSPVGEIQIGKVKNAVKNLNAWFVELSMPDGERTNCFLSAAQAAHPYLVNRTYDGRLLEGDEIVVQVIREAQKTKQPAVTTKIKLSEPNAASGTGSERGESDNPALESLFAAAAHRTCYSVLRPAPAVWETFLDHMVSEDEYTEVITDDAALYQELKQSGRFEQAAGDGSYPHGLRLREDPAWPLTQLYRLDTLMEEALQRRVWLKSGAYLVIDITEAMVVIDVNSGKCESRKASQDLIAAINREAAVEIARQLRLRSLSGEIIVDFINLKSEADCEALLSYMKELVRTDPMPVQVVDFTALGLMELTRKKGAPALAEQIRSAGSAG